MRREPLRELILSLLKFGGFYLSENKSVKLNILICYIFFISVFYEIYFICLTFNRKDNEISQTMVILSICFYRAQDDKNRML